MIIEYITGWNIHHPIIIRHKLEGVDVNYKPVFNNKPNKGFYKLRNKRIKAI